MKELIVTINPDQCSRSWETLVRKDGVYLQLNEIHFPVKAVSSIRELVNRQIAFNMKPDTLLTQTASAKFIQECDEKQANKVISYISKNIESKVIDQWEKIIVEYKPEMGYIYWVYDRSPEMAKNLAHKIRTQLMVEFRFCEFDYFP